MSKRNFGKGLLVVVELGGEWPSWVEETASASSRRVLAQLEGEAPDAFAERFALGLDGLFGRGVKLETVALACNERLDAAAQSARAKIAGLALGSMAQNKRGRVYLTASARASARLRQAFSNLVRDLEREWQRAGLEITLGLPKEEPALASHELPPRAAVA